MKIQKYIKQPERLTAIANARQAESARLILEAVEIKKNEILKEVIDRPKKCNDILKDVKAQLGMLHILDWVLNLDTNAKEHLNKT